MRWVGLLPGSRAIFCAFYLLLTISLPGQTYLKTLDHQEFSLNRKILALANGDILIGDSSIEGLRNVSVDGKIYLARLDNCGQVIWSYTYHQRNTYLEFRDFQINTVGEIFVYGSAYVNDFDEHIYLLKVSADGQMQDFRLFRTGTVDHFSYSIDIHQGMVICYGLLLDFNTRKEGFISIFDENLNFSHGIRFAPFNTGGAAIFSNAGNLICRSDAFLMSFNISGDLQWASKLNVAQVGVPIGGPFEIEDGFLLQGFQNDHTFFYKVNLEGDLVWQTDHLPANNFAADFARTPDGNIFVTYSSRISGENKLAYCVLSTNGELISSRFLQAPAKMDVAETSVSIINDRVNILANRSLYDATQSGLGDFLLQYHIDSLSTTCFNWESSNNWIPRVQQLVLTTYDTMPTNSVMDLITDTRAYYQPDSASFSDRCDSTTNLTDLILDTTLACDQNWEVNLPAADFYWLDVSNENPRSISKPGTYYARNRDCTDPILLTYTLSRPPCNCNVYLPNAITPNGDSRNEALELFSDCEVSTLQWRVYDRWGKLVFHSDSARGKWTGLLDGKLLPPGVYTAHVDYLLLDDVGEEQSGSLVRAVHLLR